MARGVLDVILRFFGFCLSTSLIGIVLILMSRAPMAPLVPLAEEQIGAFIGSEVSIDGLRLQSTSKAVELRFRTLESVGTQSFIARHGRVSLTLGRLFNLQPIPRRIEVRRILAKVSAGDAGSAAPGSVPIERILTALSGGDASDILLRAVNISYVGRDGEELVRLQRGRFRASREAGYYDIDAALPFIFSDGSETAADVRVSVYPNGNASLAFVSDGTPIQPLLSAFGVDAFSMESNVEGSVAVTVNKEGQPLGGAIDLTLSEGVGRIGSSPFSFGENVLRATFAEGRPVFRIETLSYDIAGNRGVLAGDVGADSLFDPANLDLSFDVDGRGILVDLKSFMDGPVSVAEVRAVGRFEAAKRRLALSELRSEFFGSELRGSLALTFPEGFSGSPRIESDAQLPGPLTPQQVLAGWPLPLATEARDWVIENLLEGELTDLRYQSDIPMGAIREGQGLADDTMQFSFRAEKGRVLFLPDMPEITDLSATALVRGNSFTVEGEKGFVRGVRISNARLSMPKFNPAGEEASFTGRLNGDVSTVLKALEASSLVDFSEGAYTADSFRGQGSFDLTVTWPLKEEIADDEVYVGGRGAFVRGGIDDVLPGIDATNADGEVSLNPDRVLIRGSGLAAQAPTTFEWRQNLKGEQNAELSVSAKLDTLAADMVGIPLREFFRGDVDTKVFAQDLSPGAPLTIIGELTEAAVNIPVLGVRKPRGIEGFFETTVAIPEARPDGTSENITLNALRLGSPSFNIEGAGTFTPEGGVVRLELPRLFIEETADLSLRLLTDERGIDLDIEGEYVSVGSAIDGFFAADGAGAGPLPGSVDLDVALDRLVLKNGVAIDGLLANAQHTGDYVEHLTLTGALGAEGAVSMTADRPPGSELGFVEIEATDFGALLNGIFGVSSITGGAGSIKGTTLPDEGFSGRFEMGELLIQDAPVLARILSFTSLDGLADALAGEGIRFTELEGDVEFDGARISLSDAKMVGSSLGISAAGEVNLEAGTIDVRGAVAPVFALNGFLGAIPGVGRLFVSREGEGILAFSYSITGTIDQPTVTVNALSALTPGILRRIFDPVPTVPEVLEEAEDEIERGTGLSEGP